MLVHDSDTWFKHPILVWHESLYSARYDSIVALNEEGLLLDTGQELPIYTPVFIAIPFMYEEQEYFLELETMVASISLEHHLEEHQEIKSLLYLEFLSKDIGETLIFEKFIQSQLKHKESVDVEKESMDVEDVLEEITGVFSCREAENTEFEERYSDDVSSWEEISREIEILNQQNKLEKDKPYNRLGFQEGIEFTDFLGAVTPTTAFEDLPQDIPRPEIETISDEGIDFSAVFKFASINDEESEEISDLIHMDLDRSFTDSRESLEMTEITKKIDVLSGDISSQESDFSFVYSSSGRAHTIDVIGEKSSTSFSDESVDDVIEMPILEKKNLQKLSSKTQKYSIKKDSSTQEKICKIDTLPFGVSLNVIREATQKNRIGDPSTEDIQVANVKTSDVFNTQVIFDTSQQVEGDEKMSIEKQKNFLVSFEETSDSDDQNPFSVEQKQGAPDKSLSQGYSKKTSTYQDFDFGDIEFD